MLSVGRLLIRLSQNLDKQNEGFLALYDTQQSVLVMDNNRLRALLVLMINISVTTSFSISDQRDVGDLQNPARTDEGGR